MIAARAAGASWQQIIDALGVSRQPAWEAFTAAAWRHALIDVEFIVSGDKDPLEWEPQRPPVITPSEFEQRFGTG